MMSEWRQWGLFLAVGVLLIGNGCSRSSDDDVDGDDPSAVLLEDFDAPPLAELDKTAEWEDRPVMDGQQLLKEYWAQKERIATVEEALSLKNDSPENNEKILDALGRPPESDDEVDWDAEIVRQSSRDVKSTNPLFISSTTEFDVMGLTSFGLFSFDWRMQPYAAKDTVVSWQSSKDRMYDKVVMRDDLTWSDGKPITAHDVVFSFKTIMNPKVPVPAVRSGTDEIRWVEAYDDHTLVFFHKESLATNVWNINFPVIPKHIYEKSIADDPTLQNSDYHVKYENKPVTGGPYIIESRKRNSEIVLKRREGWYEQDGKRVRSKPYFKTVRFKIIDDEGTSVLAIKEGEVEELLLNAEQWTTQTNDSDFYRLNTKVTANEWTGFHFFWNLKTPYFKDQRVREAMSYAFNHDELLDNLLYGLHQPSVGTFHPTSWMAPENPPKPYKQDLVKAEKLLDDAGWDDSDGDGIRDFEVNGELIPFEFEIICSAVDERIKICTLLKENLDRIGIVCNVKPLESTVLQQQMLEHRFQAAYGGWGSGVDPDTSENIFTTKAIDNGRNYGSYVNEEVDKLFEQGKREFDREKRADIYRKIHELLWKDQPYTWLFYRNAFYAFNKDLRGYYFSPRGPYHYDPGFFAIWKPAK
ncbi:peptide-binding protein [Thalassoroseus pseudoceratinae]|uniref:peptide-binding protein n=1 Tax=Thalassoroseus pseudoceratinae TaxID=2713176 RepID=UPI001F0DD5F3|nr:peptide-binding protein [Thalassoroseus pseudoceratinae]